MIFNEILVFSKEEILKDINRISVSLHDLTQDIGDFNLSRKSAQEQLESLSYAYYELTNRMEIEYFSDPEFMHKTDSIELLFKETRKFLKDTWDNIYQILQKVNDIFANEDLQLHIVDKDLLRVYYKLSIIDINLKLKDRTNKEIEDQILIAVYNSI